MNANEYTIEVTINEDGEVEATVGNIKGTGCEGLTQFLEELGNTVEHRSTTDYRRHQGVNRRTKVGH